MRIWVNLPRSHQPPPLSPREIYKHKWGKIIRQYFITLFRKKKLRIYRNTIINYLLRCIDALLFNSLLGSMYFWSWLIQLNRSYKYIGKFACTEISTLNGHISETVQNFEKLKKIRCNYFSILGLDRWFWNFSGVRFGHFWLIWVRFWSFFGC